MDGTSNSATPTRLIGPKRQCFRLSRRIRGDMVERPAAQERSPAWMKPRGSRSHGSLCRLVSADWLHQENDHVRSSRPSDREDAIRPMLPALFSERAGISDLT